MIARDRGRDDELGWREVLRRARPEDVGAMRAWRNHEEVRRVSLTQHVISPEEHRAWWERIQQDPTTLVLVYEREAIPSGVVTFFDLDGKSAWWGYYLDNQSLMERGSLFPAWISIQREAVRYARDELGLTELHGETVATNDSAVSFNKRQGFVEVERHTRDVSGEQVEVIHSRRTFEQENHG